MMLRQLFDRSSCTYTYLLADGSEALLIDPVFEHARRDAALIRELGLTLRWTLETHIHADHVTGAWLLKQWTGCQMAAGSGCGSTAFDRLLAAGETVAFGGRHLTVRPTPGHTAGCVTYVLDDETAAFTGDALLVRGAGRTDFQGGDARTLYRSVTGQILTLPDACRLYPAHDYGGRTVTSVAEEKDHNPRLGGSRSEDDFAGYMDALGLAHPGKIDIAVPGNLQAGQPDDPTAAEESPGWAPLTWTFAGAWELDGAWLEENRSSVTVLDVREPHEFDGELGHIEGAVLVPLGELSERADTLDPHKPIVAVCRAGGRSIQATVLLRRKGIDAAASLRGGMLAWRAERRG